MAHRDFKVDRLVCCNQGSIHTGIVLNPAGPCAARHGPYGVSDFRVAIDSLPCDEVVVSVGCLPAFPFQVFFEAVLQAWDSNSSKRNLLSGSYGSESKEHIR